jgi:D-cysteine desulfhydrase
VNEIMQEESEILRRRGKNVYVIPEGGSTTLGIWGYISFVDELSKQIDLKSIEGILLAAGTGGTAAGILAGLARRKIKINIYAVNVLYNENIIRRKILQLAQGAVLDFNLANEIDSDGLYILNGYSEEGYKKINRSKLQLVNKFFRESGILLDPAYTGKAFCGFYDKFIRKNKRSNILFLHTGGLFGTFGRRREYLVSNSSSMR